MEESVTRNGAPTRADVISYLVDCLCMDREEAEQTVSENYCPEEFLSDAQMEEMQEFLGYVATV
jgi:hypothetical protein